MVHGSLLVPPFARRQLLDGLSHAFLGGFDGALGGAGGRLGLAQSLAPSNPRGGRRARTDSPPLGRRVSPGSPVRVEAGGRPSSLGRRSGADAIRLPSGLVQDVSITRPRHMSPGADAAGAVRNDAGLATLGTASEARSLSARSLLDSGDAARHMPLLSGLLGLGMCDTPHTANLRGARRREKQLSLDGEALSMYSDGRSRGRAFSCSQPCSLHS